MEYEIEEKTKRRKDGENRKNKIRTKDYLPDSRIFSKSSSSLRGKNSRYKQ